MSESGKNLSKTFDSKSRINICVKNQVGIVGKNVNRDSKQRNELRLIAEID